MYKQKTNAGPSGFSENTIKTKTGRSSKQWFRFLDKWGAHKHGHTNTARFLQKKYKVSDWWAQALTVRYEYARHLRKPLRVPHLLHQALARSKTALKQFESLPPSHQREYIEYVIDAKKLATRKRRIGQTIERLNRASE